MLLRIRILDPNPTKTYKVINKTKKGKTKDKVKDKEEQEQVIRKVIEEKMDIRGGYAKPSWTDILWVQIIILPWTLYNYVRWYINWIYRFTICKEEYGEPEKFYLIRKNLGLSQLEFEVIFCFSISLNSHASVQRPCVTLMHLSIYSKEIG